MTSSLASLLYELPEPDPKDQPPAPVPAAPLATHSPEVQALARIGAALFHWSQAASGIEEKLAASDPDAASRLRIAREEVRDGLNDAGILIENPMGKPLSAVIDVASIRGWRHQEGAPPETVCQVIAPVIHHRGSLVRRGQVIMASTPPGGPPTKAQDPPQTSISPKRSPIQE
jgi:hypothetical protein